MSSDSEELSIPLNMRVPSGIMKVIDDHVETNKWRNRSEFIMAAIRHYLDHLSELERYQVYKFYLSETP